MRKTIIVLTCAMCILLSGCTVEADRVYVVCRIEGETVSCYKSENDFYTVQSDGTLLPSLDPTLRAYPALNFEPKSVDYNLTPDIPGLYHGTLRELEGYVFTLLANEFTDFDVYYTDYRQLELFVYSDTDTYRILYNIVGEIRIYSENNHQILYLNKKESY